LFLRTNKTLYSTKHIWVASDPDRLTVSLADILLLVSCAIWLLSPRRPLDQTRRAGQRLYVPLAALSLCFLPSFVNSIYPVLGLLELARMAKCALLYWFLMYNVRDLKEVRWLIGCFGFSLFIQLGITLVQKFGYGSSLGSGMVFLGEGSSLE